jgi:hypothetical protein
MLSSLLTDNVNKGGYRARRLSCLLRRFYVLVLSESSSIYGYTLPYFFEKEVII